MSQNTSIEELPVLLDRLPDSDAVLAETWLDLQVAPLTESLVYEDPSENWDLSPFIKLPTQNALLNCLQSLQFGDAVRRMILHPNGEVLFTVGSPTRSSQPDSTNTIQVWNWRTGDRLCSLEGHLAPITAIALSQNGATLVSGSRDRTIKVWNVPAGKERTTLRGHNSPITAIALSPDGQTVVSSGCNQYELRDRQAHIAIRDRTLRVWSLPQSTITHVLPCITDVPTLVIAPSGKTLLKSEPRSQVLDLETGKTISSLNWLTEGERLLAITPDWERVATIVSQQVAIRQMTTGEVYCQIELDSCDRSIHIAALSPNGKRFVAGFQRTDIHPKFGNYLTRQAVLRIWNTDTGELLGSLSQADLGQGLWQSIKFSEQGNLLVTSVGDSLKVWQFDC